jgi:HEPN domain-containing protein
MEVPLKIHSLSRLAERTRLDKQLSEEQLDFIDKLEPLNIEARYPSYKERLMKSLNTVLNF